MTSSAPKPDLTQRAREAWIKIITQESALSQQSLDGPTSQAFNTGPLGL